MKNEKIFLDRLNELDDELILEAESAHKSSGNRWIKILAVAAIICVLLALTIMTVFSNIDTSLNADEGGSLEDGGDLEDVLQVPISDVYWVDTREKKANAYTSTELGIVWPWNCRAVYDKYTSISFNGSEYRARSSYYGGKAFENQIGKKLLDGICSGYDSIENVSYSIDCEVFEIVGVDSNRIVAVKYDGFDGYYAFMRDEYAPPETLGALIKALDLTNNVKLNNFYYDEHKNGSNDNYALSNEVSAELWNILIKYGDSAFIDETVYDYSKKLISFALNSNTLGVYNLSFSFSEDGFLRTNIENYAYTYNIGREAVKEIKDIVLKNRLAVVLPEKQYLVGTVTEIGEDYIKVDDSVVMKNADQGIEFTVYADNMNIKRYIISGYLKVGDTVKIEHGYLLKNSYTEIRNAVDLEECRILDNGDVIVPE